MFIDLGVWYDSRLISDNYYNVYVRNFLKFDLYVWQILFYQSLRSQEIFYFFELE